jgi:hypothetical protein
MKQVLTATCLAAAFAVGLSAQTPQTPPTQTPQSPTSTAQEPQSRSADRDASKTLTVQGCLKAGDSADAFTLSDLKWGSSSSSATGSSATGAVGTSGTAPTSIGAASTLTIKPKGDAKLSEHVGHQVEVTGTVSDKASSASSSTSSSSAANPTDPTASRPSTSASAPTFEARSVKMIAATCSM